MKEICLTKGKIALVNDFDFERLNQWKWYADRIKNKVYAARKNPKKIYMHREILKVKNFQYVDHINGNGLDNRRENLRICTNSQNGQNRGKNKNNTSGFKGVCFHARTQTWIASIWVNRQRVHLGYFKGSIDAAIAYNEAAVKYHGKFAFLNEISVL